MLFTILNAMSRGRLGWNAGGPKSLTNSALMSTFQCFSLSNYDSSSMEKLETSHLKRKSRI